MISDKKKQQLKYLHSLPKTKKWLDSIRHANTGRIFSEETRRKIGDKNRIHGIGRKLGIETRKKLSDCKKGDKHWNWKGGISNNPYPKEFTPTLKRQIRERDFFTCQLCGKTEREELEEINRVLCVNHINFDKNDCRPENLNTLCVRCNVKINRQREYYQDFFNRSELL